MTVERPTQEHEPASPSLGPSPPPWRQSTPAYGRRRLGWVGISIICTGIVALAALYAVAFSSLRAKTYGGRVDIVYLPDASVGLDVRERVLATQAAILTSRAVLGPVAAQRRVSLTDLQGAVSVKLGLNDVLEVTVAAPNRAMARVLAQSVADEYVRFTAALPNPPVVRVLSPAYTLADPISPTIGPAVAIGLLIGLQVAIVLAVWLARRRRST